MRMLAVTQERSMDVLANDEPAQKLLVAFLSGRSECTRRAYRQDLDDFCRFVGASKASEAATLLLSRGHGQANALALAWRANLHERRLQAATINRRLAALRSLVQLARTLGIVSWALEVQNVRSESYRDTRGPGLNGVRLLLNEVERRCDAKSIRDRAILRLLYDLGLRRSEVVTLDLGDLDLPAGTVAVLGKGRTQKTYLTIPEPTGVALNAWLEARGTEAGPLFTNLDRAGKGCRLTGTSLYRIVRRLGAQVGLKVRPHGLRHSAITEACKAAQANGMGLEEVLDFSRHRVSIVAELYKHLSQAARAVPDPDQALKTRTCRLRARGTIAVESPLGFGPRPPHRVEGRGNADREEEYLYPISLLHAGQ